MHLFTLVVAVSAAACIVLFFTYFDDGSNLIDQADFSYIAGGYFLLLAVYMVWSFIGLNKVINHLLDGNLNAEFKLLRTTYFFWQSLFSWKQYFFRYISCTTS